MITIVNNDAQVIQEHQNDQVSALERSTLIVTDDSQRVVYPTNYAPQDQGHVTSITVVNSDDPIKANLERTLHRDAKS